MPNDGKTTMDVFRRFPKNRETLIVRWLKRHDVMAPLDPFYTVLKAKLLDGKTTNFDR